MVGCGVWGDGMGSVRRNGLGGRGIVGVRVGAVGIEGGVGGSWVRRSVEEERWVRGVGGMVLGGMVVHGVILP